jgi:hypothetical protein
MPAVIPYLSLLLSGRRQQLTKVAAVAPPYDSEYRINVVILVTAFLRAQFTDRELPPLLEPIWIYEIRDACRPPHDVEVYVTKSPRWPSSARTA